MHNVRGCTRFDYQINNGGMGSGMPFTDVTEQFFDQIMATDFKGPYFLTQHLLVMLEDGGRIVNTSSNSSYKTFAGYTTYGPSKAAMAAWTRYLAKETAPGRIGRPDDMAKVIAGMVSDDSGRVTAQDIEVSGGPIL